MTAAHACLAAAIEYAEHGWRVLPVQGKVPLLPAWSRPDGSGAASTDPDQIRAWWTRWPAANVGVATGPASSLAVLDIDPRSGGDESFAALEGRVGPLPGTVTSLTGGGGLHLLFAHPGRRVTSRANALGLGLDVKADGGMIVAPPSVHPDTGRAYAWLGGAWRDELPVWPEALDDLLAPPPAKRPPAGPVPAQRGANGGRLLGILTTMVEARPGERNAVLFWAAARVGEMHAAGDLPDLAAAVHALRDAALAAGLTAGEIGDQTRGTIGSGLRVLA